MLHADEMIEQAGLSPQRDVIRKLMATYALDACHSNGIRVEAMIILDNSHEAKLKESGNYIDPQKDVKLDYIKFNDVIGK